MPSENWSGYLAPGSNPQLSLRSFASPTDRFDGGSSDDFASALTHSRGRCGNLCRSAVGFACRSCIFLVQAGDRDLRQGRGVYQYPAVDGGGRMAPVSVGGTGLYGAEYSRDEQKAFVNGLLGIIYDSYDSTRQIRDTVDSIHRLCIAILVILVLFVIVSVAFFCFFGCKKYQRGRPQLPRKPIEL